MMTFCVLDNNILELGTSWQTKLINMHQIRILSVLNFMHIVSTL